MTWSHKRQFIIIGILFLFVCAILAYPTYQIFFNKIPTCFDNSKNGDETGVDCGGSCAKICKAGAADVVVHWRRVFQVAPGVYSVAAEIENINGTYAAFQVPYVFSLLDGQKVQIAERKGVAYIAPRTTSIIFEANLETGTRMPQAVNFQIVTNPQWYEGVATDRPLPRISNEELENTDASTAIDVSGESVNQALPKYTARLSNDTLDEMKQLEVVAVLYDKEGNAVAVSKTAVDSIAKQSYKDVVFTWRLPFKTSVVSKQMYITYVPSQKEREAIMLNPVKAL